MKNIYSSFAAFKPRLRYIISFLFSVLNKNNVIMARIALMNNGRRCILKMVINKNDFNILKCMFQNTAEVFINIASTLKVGTIAYIVG